MRWEKLFGALGVGANKAVHYVPKKRSTLIKRLQKINTITMEAFAHIQRSINATVEKISSFIYDVLKRNFRA